MSLPIIDTHQHLWDLSVFQLAWTEGGGPLAKSHLMSDYLEAASAVNITRTVYMEVDLDPSQRIAEAEYVSGLCDAGDNPMAAAVISGEPSDANFAEYVAQFGSNTHIKGIRRILHQPETPQGHCLQEAFVRGVQALGERDLSFDICMRPGELGDAVKLVSQCPDTRFVIDHCGNADPRIVRGAIPGGEISEWEPFLHGRQQWMDDMSALASHGNTICKISGIIARVQPDWTAAVLAPAVDHCLQAFGPDRVVFGGDWPVCTIAGATLKEWVEALLEIISSRTEQEQRQLLSENAERFYRLG